MKVSANVIQLIEKRDNKVISALVNHFLYSIKDIKSYDELTDEEKKIISKETFDLMTVRDQPNNQSKKYLLVQWPESQYLMDHERFNECLFVDNLDGHENVGSDAYMCPEDLYNEIFSYGTK